MKINFWFKRSIYDSNYKEIYRNVIWKCDYVNVINDFLNDIYRIMISNFKRWGYINCCVALSTWTTSTIRSVAYIPGSTPRTSTIILAAIIIVSLICCIIRVLWNWKCKALKDCLSLICTTPIFLSFIELQISDGNSSSNSLST